MPMMNNKNLLIGTIIVVLLIGAGLILASKNSKKTATVSPTPSTAVMPTETIAPQETATPAATEAMKKEDSAVKSEVKTINVEASNFKFSPTEIKVKKGEKVKIVLTSKDGLHDWVVDEFSGKTKQINEGETSETEFTADKAGTFEYYCSVGKHRAMGMVGKLIVE